MIPYQITLYNFLSYGQAPQTISFEGYGLICLSGRNGHGKSALLDAMTWALWGQARKTTGTGKPDEGLLRLGSRSMMVMFEFYVGDRLYRVRREFSLRQGNKAHLTLDIGVYDVTAASYHSLTDKTIRQTQASINRIVGLEYDTYVNSAYLRQGNANEFSQKAPKERKKILSAILGIDKYDVLQTKALERARDFSNKADLLKELVARDEVDLEQYPIIIVQEERVLEELTDIEKLLYTYEVERDRLQKTYAQYEATEREFSARSEMLSQERRHMENERRSWGGKVAAYRSELAALGHLGTRGQIQEHLQQLRSKEQVLRAQQKKVMGLQHTSMILEKELFSRENKIQQELSLVHQEVLRQQHATSLAHEQAKGFANQLRVQKEQLLAEQATLQQQNESLNEEIRKLRDELVISAVVRARFDKRKVFYNTYVPRLRWLEQQQEERSRKVLMVGNESPSCPLCEQMLTTKRKHFLHDKLQKELGVITHQSARLQNILERLKSLLVEDHAVVKKSEAVHNALQGACGQQEVVVARIAHIQIRLMAVEEALTKAIAEVSALQIQLDAFIGKQAAHEKEAALMLSQDGEIVRLKNSLQAAEKEVVALNYNEQEHVATEQQIASASAQVLAIEQIDQRRGELVSLRADIDAQRRHLKEVARALQAKEEVLHAGRSDSACGLKLASDLALVRDVITDLLKQKQALATQQGSIAAQRSRLEQQRAGMMAHLAEIAVLEAKHYDCTTLAQAWSKNGIQALLIEQAIPEIEYEANELLSRLSNNQAQVFIESLRDLKRGGARETLDIKIADVMGVRPYEMFSGGEAFRIDFSLRIAISKLLAKRAGATLQVLIIDEGFGSQDEEGLSRLMQALYEIQDDFAKIIVVTHLPAFKENFPVHFIVEKGSAGSLVSIEQRG